MQFIPRYTRIISSGKVADRYIIAQIKNTPGDEKINKGTIFALIEIINPYSTSIVQIGQSIINAFTREYLKSTNSSDLVNFELGLKKVNETLAQITQDGETEWIGKLNACLMVLCENQINIAKAGKINAFLIRQNKISSIVDNSNNNNPPHPLKTFVDIISGSLNPGDKLLLSNELIFDYFSQDSLKQIISSNQPLEACYEIADKLVKSKEKRVNLFICELITKDQFADLTVNEDEIDTVYLDQARLTNFSETRRELFDKFNKFSEKTKLILSNIYQKTHHAVTRIILPKSKIHIKKFLDYSHSQLNKSKEHFQNKTLPVIKKTIGPVTKKITEKTKNLIKNDSQEKPVNKNSSDYLVHHYYSESNKKIIYFFKNFGYYFKKFIQFLIKLYKWLIEPRNRSFLYALIIIVLSTILIFNIGNLKSKQSNKEKETLAAQNLSTAQTLFNDDYKLATLYNDKIKAKNVLSEIINLSNSYGTKDQTVINGFNEIKNKAQTELDKLNKINRVKNLKTIAEIDNIDLFSANQDFLFTFNKTLGSVVAVNKSQGEKDNLALPDSNDKIVAMGASDDLTNNYFLTNQKKLYKTDSPLKEIQEIKNSQGDWKDAIKITTFSNNLYFLDTINSQIWKYAPTNDGYANPQEYLAQKVDLTKTVDMTIDGLIYLLNSDGKIVKLAKGKSQDFNITEIPLPDSSLTNPKKIYANADYDNLYVLDANRLLELDKNGKFIAQYVFNDLNDLKDFAINTKTKEIWLLNGNKIYKGNL